MGLKHKGECSSFLFTGGLQRKLINESTTQNINETEFRKPK